MPKASTLGVNPENNPYLLLFPAGGRPPAAEGRPGLAPSRAGAARVVPRVGLLVVVAGFGFLDDEPGEREPVVVDEEAVDVFEPWLLGVKDPAFVGRRVGTDELAAER